MQETPRTTRASFGTEREAAAHSDFQGSDTTIYTYEADRLVAMLCLEPASITSYHYDACGDWLDGAADALTSDNPPSAATD